jgi:ABC-type transporter MlaC component
MSPDGSYCETYLKDLKVAYYMYDWFMENVYDTLTEEQKEKSDEAYEQILDKVYGEN